MNRHELRKEVFKAVFMNDFHQPEEMTSVVDCFWQGRDDAEKDDLANNNKSSEDAQYVTEKVTDILAKIPELDERINASIDGWKTSRMAKVDLTLIRLALYEIKYENLPIGVAINEAVTLAEEFGADSSAGFVNGALSKLINE